MDERFLDFLRDAARAILSGGERFVLIRRGRAVLEHALPGPLAILGGGVAFRSDLEAEDPALLEELYAEGSGRYLLDGGLVLAYGRPELVEQLVALTRRPGPEALTPEELGARRGGPALIARWRAGDDRLLDADRRTEWARQALAAAARGRARLRWGDGGPRRERRANVVQTPVRTRPRRPTRLASDLGKRF
ncbi:MAG TPA: hypothetical protein VNO79_11910 [Actinomycetota bacterium]|nr:hypothetical protein [Actinomycetota bacterium]